MNDARVGSSTEIPKCASQRGEPSDDAGGARRPTWLHYIENLSPHYCNYPEFTPKCLSCWVLPLNETTLQKVQKQVSLSLLHCPADRRRRPRSLNPPPGAPDKMVTCHHEFEKHF